MFFFHLGTNPTIALREIESRYPEISLEKVTNRIFSTETPIEDIKDVQHKLGGVIMISKYVGGLASSDPENIKEVLINHITQLLNNSEQKKLSIAASSANPQMDYNALLFSIKKTFKEKNISIRVIVPKKGEINTAHIQKERLLKQKGMHVWIINTEEATYITQTISTQNIDTYSFRDYEKPFRDAKIGMLPPKLAQTMVNLAHPNKKILDPFCGSGTVLLEGLRLGLEIDGSDIEEKCVDGTIQNVEWYSSHTRSEYKAKVSLEDAQRIDNIEEKYEAIVTEGYLGLPYSQYPSEKDIFKNFKFIDNLYRKFFQAATSILEENGKIVICFPVYHGKNENTHFLEYFQDTLQTLPFELVKKPLLYGRDNQIVWREIIELRKI